MAVLRGLALVAGEELPVQDQAAAHSGADEETDHVIVAFGSAVLMLAQDA